MKGKHTVNIPGELASVASNGVVTSADGVYDYNQNRTQEDINADTEGRLDGQDLKITKKLAEIDQKYNEFEDKTDEYFKQESAKNDKKINEGIAGVAKIPDNEILVVDSLPDTGKANTVYRVPGEHSYSEWAYRNNAWVKLAEYNNGIDEEPTAGSENLVKSGGVYDIIDGTILSVDIQKSDTEMVGTWIYKKNLKAGKKYIATSYENSSTTFILRYNGEEKYKIEHFKDSMTVEITPDTDIDEIRGYTSGNFVKLDVVLEEAVANKLRNINNVIEKNSNYITELGKDNFSYRVNVEPVESPSTWRTNKHIPAGEYLLYNYGNTTSFYVNNNKNSEHLFYSSSFKSGAQLEMVLEEEGELIGGFSENVDIVIIAKNNPIYERTISHENQINNLDNAVNKIKGVVGELLVIKQSSPDSSPLTWVVEHNFIKGVTYIIRTGENTSSSCIFRNAKNEEIHRLNIRENNEYEVILEEDAAVIRGYSSAGYVDLTVVEKDSIQDEIYNIKNNDDILYFNSPSDYDTLINGMKIGKVGSGGAHKEFVSILHFSDIHAVADNAERINRFYENYKNSIDDVLCTGDIVAYTYNTENVLDKYKKFLITIGNHDAWTTSYDEEIVDRQQTEALWIIKQKVSYDKFISTNVDNWGVVQPDGAAESGKCFYYKDYLKENNVSTVKLRLIVLDCMRFNAGEDIVNGSSVQLNWLKSVLEDARTKEIPVVIASHYPPVWVNVSNPEVIKCAYSNSDYLSSDILNNEAAEAVQAFIDNGGEFVCWLVGHAHTDIIAVPRDYPKQVYIMVDSTIPSSSKVNGSRIVGTKSQDSFNVVSFDTDEKLIKLVKVGNDTTRELKSKRRLVYRYADYSDEFGNHEKGIVLCE